MFPILIWGVWSFVWGAKPTKAPGGDGTGTCSNQPAASLKMYRRSKNRTIIRLHWSGARIFAYLNFPSD